MPEQTDARYCVLVNGHAVEPGCWVDGHWGQYGPDHLADRAEELGWEPADEQDDPRHWRSVALTHEAGGHDGNACDAWDYHLETADAIEAWLNDHTETEGYTWGWHDGEFYLWPAEIWEDEG